MTPPTLRRRHAFTLIELLVVISIIALLIGILLPVLGSARMTARQMKCLSNMRQWGIAYAAYAAENKDYLPREDGDRDNGTFPGLAQFNQNPQAWFNSLPSLINAPKYGDIYDGSVPSILDEYENAWFWYCPEKINEDEKNSSSGLNSFHYGQNALLNGEQVTFPATLNFLPDAGKDRGRWFVRIDNFARSSETVLQGEVFGNVAVVFPDPDGPGTGANGRLEFQRHDETKSNIAFLDGHVSLFTTHQIEKPGPDNANFIDSASGPGPWRNQNLKITWGPEGRQ